MADAIADTPAPAGAAAPAAPSADTPAPNPAPTPDTPKGDATPPSGDDKGAAPAPDAPKPDDWATRREAYANGDEKLSKRLARYSSEKDVVDALIAAQNKISAGELTAPLPKDATPEQVADWREANGIPVEPTGYDLTGLELGEVDKPIVDDFLKLVHSKNLPPETVKDIVKWNQDNAAAILEARRAEDARLKVEGTAALKEAWGSEFELNSSLIKGLLDTAPKGIGDGIMAGRLADGTPITSSPEALRWLASIAREMNPTATLVPGSGNNAEQSLANEKAELIKMSGDRSKNSEYWHGQKAAKHQARLLELNALELKMKR